MLANSSYTAMTIWNGPTARCGVVPESFVAEDTDLRDIFILLLPVLATIFVVCGCGWDWSSFPSVLLTSLFLFSLFFCLFFFFFGGGISLLSVLFYGGELNEGDIKIYV